jgi:NAD(P)-dependent dehydrogenase (short-subunit alcohol dehydrogenase family)
MELGLDGKTALITGGSQGIGLAVAHNLAAEGCHLHLAARTEADLAAAADHIRAASGVEVTVHAADLSQTPALEALGAACSGVDILINNAGAIPRGGLEDLDDAALRQTWELKLFGYINLTRIIYAAMKERGAGAIVNVIGGAAHIPRADNIAGTMANVALVNFTKALGKESTLHGVRVIGLHPGTTRTRRMETQYGFAAERRFGDATRWLDALPPLPFERPVEPEETADMVAFLVSERASYTSGVVFNVSGGR